MNNDWCEHIKAMDICPVKGCHKPRPINTNDEMCRCATKNEFFSEEEVQSFIKDGYKVVHKACGKYILPRELFLREKLANGGNKEKICHICFSTLESNLNTMIVCQVCRDKFRK